MFTLICIHRNSTCAQRIMGYCNNENGLSICTASLEGSDHIVLFRGWHSRWKWTQSIPLYQSKNIYIVLDVAKVKIEHCLNRMIYWVAMWIRSPTLMKMTNKANASNDQRIIKRKRNFYCLHLESKPTCTIYHHNANTYPILWQWRWIDIDSAF